MNEEKQIEKLKEQIKKIDNDLTEIVSIRNNKTSHENTLISFSKLNKDTESLALAVRKTLISMFDTTPYEANYDSTNPYSYINDSFIDCTKIDNSLIKIEAPPLLNFKALTKKNNRYYVSSPVYFVSVMKDKIKEFIIKNSYQINTKKKIVFVFNIISSDASDGNITDTDNREYREIYNVIKEFFVPDDSYKYVSYYTDTLKIGDQDKTIIFISDIDSYEENIAKIYNFLYGEK